MAIYLVDEARLSHVGEATDEQGARVGIDGRKTGEMLTHLLQVRQTLALSLHHRTHPGRGGGFL